MDIEMPKIDGLNALAYLMTYHPVPTVMVSAYTQTNAEMTIRALGYGAVDFVAKPSGTISLDMALVKDELIYKVKEASQADVKKIHRLTKAPTPTKSYKFKKGKRAIVLGASAGGPHALIQVLSNLPNNILAPILVVQHMPEGFTKTFAERLSIFSQLDVKEAEEGDKLKPNKVLLAPGGYHMRIDNQTIYLDRGPLIHSVRPAVDPTMEDIARDFGPGAIGVVMTGMGQDGARGLKSIKSHGGHTIAQNEETSIVFGMPKTAIEMGAAEHILPLDKIPKMILELIENKAQRK